MDEFEIRTPNKSRRIEVSELKPSLDKVRETAQLFTERANLPDELRILDAKIDAAIAEPSAQHTKPGRKSGTSQTSAGGQLTSETHPE
jgi:hypothetical protein